MCLIVCMFVCMCCDECKCLLSVCLSVLTTVIHKLFKRRMSVCMCVCVCVCLHMCVCVPHNYKWSVANIKTEKYWKNLCLLFNFKTFWILTQLNNNNKVVADEPLAAMGFIFEEIWKREKEPKTIPRFIYKYKKAYLRTSKKLQCKEEPHRFSG